MNGFVYRFEVMTTPCELILYTKTKSRADKTAHLILKESKRLEKKYNYFSPNSYLSAINKRAENSLDMETKYLLKKALLYYEKTEHIFDITMGTIKEIYNNASNIIDLESKKQSLLPFVGCNHIDIQKNIIKFDNPYTQIDLGGFVKEYAVDRAVAIMRSKKIDAGLINFGGDIYALGYKPNGDRFRIGIKDPNNVHNMIKFIEIENEALTTSASYERYQSIEGKNFSHIIGRDNIAEMARSVTVVSSSCLESGVYSTALMVSSKITTTNRVFIA